MQALAAVAFLPVLASSSLFASGGPSPWAWSLIATQGTAPDARQGHAAVEVGRKIYVIGGCVQEIRCFNDVHVFDTGSRQWTKETVSGEAPEPRGGHTATMVGADIFVVGGANSEETFADVHRLDLSQKRWTRFREPRDGAKPVRRTSHAAAADANGRVYIFGGYDADGNFLNDLWMLKTSPSPADGQETPPEAFWARHVPTGEVPEAREGHSLTLVDRKLLLFGGYTESGHDVNDVHQYDIAGQQWTKLDLSGDAPHPRQAHSAARHGHQLVVAGGCDVSGATPQCFSDVWTLSLLDMQWSKRSSEAAATWAAREGHSASFVGGRMFAFGGCQLGSDCFADVSVLDTLDPCPGGCGNHGQCVDGLYCKCTEPGFTGHDCLQPLTCKVDCGLHGACGQDGQCACAEGWTGTDCLSPPRCPGSPLPCSGRGECLPGGRCKCQLGAAGLDCFSDAVAAVAAVNSSQAATAAPVAPHSAARAEQSVAMRASLLALNASNPGKKAAGIPKASDFGIAKVNKEGHADGATPDCTNNCNWRGLCEGGVCYCQPGFTGDICQTLKEDKSGTLSILVTGILAGISVLTTFVTTYILLIWKNSTKGSKEQESGYLPFAG
eukprot:gb/GFBE01005794.1/.p1 GENE.gb/GFBE01005794.1/~~gb/GFBE01005794.1/.p1  ORF type:complete len:610 (+),score=97.38 gb/GFBE01005794.1/:1-1830(+)